MQYLHNSLKLFASLISLGGILLIGNGAIAHEDPGNNIKALTAHIESEPDNAKLYADRGKLYRVEKDWQLALDDFQRAVELKHDPAPLDIYIGEAMLGVGNPDGAIEYLNRYMKNYPTDSMAPEIRGDAYLLQNNYKAAATDYGTAIERSPGPRPELFLKRADAQVAGGDTDAALATIDGGVTRLGGVISMIQRAIDLEAGRENYAAALAWLDRIPPKLQVTPDWLLKRGDLLALAGRQEDAERAWQRADTTWNEMPEIRRELAASQKLRKTIDERMAAISND